ncbi:arginase family protein [Humidisolicoccus flavus]|uniref:arginase family protein n=1 Tax=Humidisolicoccus flavus TaxID=3111414 RepID=UPI00324433B6
MNAAQLPHDPSWPRAGQWPERSEHPELTLIGVPTSASSLSPTNAHETPAAIRAALPRFGVSAMTSSGVLDLQALRVRDVGDLAGVNEPGREIEAIERIRALASEGGVILALGGDNACTVSTARGVWGETITEAGLITLDAHHDLRDGISNGSPVRQLIEAGLDSRRTVQIGIADFANSPEYTRRAIAQGITIVPRNEISPDRIPAITAAALDTAGPGPIHLDIDVDICDRSVAPACPASVPGGISAQELRALVRHLVRDPRVRSIDIAEIDASRDTPDQRTVRLGALLVLECAAALLERRAGEAQ